MSEHIGGTLVKRIAYLCDEVITNGTSSLGVRRKVLSQVGALRKAGFDCNVLTYKAPNTLLETIMRRLPFIPEAFRWPSVDCLHGVDVIYVRNPGVTSSFIRFLRRVKHAHPNVIIALEFPSYPYDKELIGRGRLPLLIKEKFSRIVLHKYVDVCFTYSEDEQIFGIPAHHIINGIDMGDIPLRSPALEPHDSLNLICVAVFNEWHGIDRVIKGIADYRDNGGTKNIRLHLVGDGPASETYRALSKKLGTDSNVVFHGRMLPEDYAAVFDYCDFAIECLGCHRKGVMVSSSLKSREYLARGMPFIYSGVIDVFQDNPVDFCLRVESDESPIDINRLFCFYGELYERLNALDLAKQIRLYAENHVSMDVAMKPVVDYIGEL